MLILLTFSERYLYSFLKSQRYTILELALKWSLYVFSADFALTPCRTEGTSFFKAFLSDKDVESETINLMKIFKLVLRRA